MPSQVFQAPLMVVRTDANHRMGAGHFMRSIALAQAWQDHGGKAVFLGKIESGILCERLAMEQIELIQLPGAFPDQCDADTVLNYLADKDMSTGWIVVDGYHFNQDYQQIICASGWHILVVDDMGHLPEYTADIVLNQNPGNEEIIYRVSPETLILRGERYILLRREFLNTNFPITPIASRAHHILVTLGGADPGNNTKRILEALEKVNDKALIVKVVVGPTNPYLNSLTTAASDAGYTIELITAANNMPALMRWADLAVSGAGTTCWELAHMGVPFAVAILADNQEIVASTLAAHEAAVVLGRSKKWHDADTAAALRALINDHGSRQYMRQQAGKLVDGRGSERVVQSMLCYNFTLRSAAPGDCKTIFEWRNDPDTRRFSFQTKKILWHEHKKWFEKALASSDILFYIAEVYPGEPAGQVRFTRNGRELLISVGLAAAYRGCGLGARLIKKASKRAMHETGADRVRALIKKDNTSSLQSFLRAGFSRLGEAKNDGITTVELQMNIVESSLGTAIGLKDS